MHALSSCVKSKSNYILAHGIFKFPNHSNLLAMVIFALTQ